MYFLIIKFNQWGLADQMLKIGWCHKEMKRHGNDHWKVSEDYVDLLHLFECHIRGTFKIDAY